LWTIVSKARWGENRLVFNGDALNVVLVMGLWIRVRVN
jgi:hypothetical protein